MAHHQLFSGPSMNHSNIIIIILKVCIPTDGLLTGSSLNRNVSNQVKQEVNQNLTLCLFMMFDPFFNGYGRIYPHACRLFQSRWNVLDLEQIWLLVCLWPDRGQQGLIKCPRTGRLAFICSSLELISPRLRLCEWTEVPSPCDMCTHTESETEGDTQKSLANFPRKMLHKSDFMDERSQESVLRMTLLQKNKLLYRFRSCSHSHITFSYIIISKNLDIYYGGKIHAAIYITMTCCITIQYGGGQCKWIFNLV